MVRKNDEVKACIQCGSTNISSTTLGPGMHMPEGGGPPTHSYKDCGLISNPIIFDSEKDYQKFLKLKRERGK